MLKYRLTSVMLASVLGLTACGGDVDRTADPDAPINQTKTQPIFNPAARQFPIPNDLLFGPETAEDAEGNDVPVEQNDGTMFAGVDPANPVIGGIDALDGNSVLAPFDIAFNGSLNTAQNLDASSFVAVGGNVIPNPDQNVFLLALDYPGGDGLLQVSGEVPTLAEAAAYVGATADPANPNVAVLQELAAPVARAEIISLDGGTNNVLRINPLKPLQPKTKYLVVITNLEDAQGEAVEASTPYQVIKDPNTTIDSFGNPAFVRLRAAIEGWERLAAGFFSFKQQVFTAIGSPASAPSVEDIIFTITFTTGGTTDVLQYIAAPEKFFEDSLSTGFKKDAITKLIGGQYMLDGTTNIDPPTAIDAATAATMSALLTSPTVPGTDMPNALFNPAIAGAITAGADYATIAADATAAYLMQRAAAEAAIVANNGDGITIAMEAAGTVNAIVAGVSAQVGVDLPKSAIFPVPAPRPSTFYRVDAANQVFPALPAANLIYQGEITLPYYQTEATEDDLSPTKTSSWQADDTLREILSPSGDGDLPRSDKVTYRYPFPAKQSDVTIPVMVTTPNEALVPRPDEGWPVIIFVHGITGERSTSLPMANALAAACLNPADGSVIPGIPCFATIAIDQPLHGIAAEGSKLATGAGVSTPALVSVSNPEGFDVPAESMIPGTAPSENLAERHFNATSDAAANPIPMNYDAEFGSSGTLFINLTNFSNVRDNLRQMSVDLMNLNASLGSMDLNADGNADEFDTNRVYMVGHSLGAINGLPFVATNNSAATQSYNSDLPRVIAASGLVTGGGVTRLLTNSPNFAPSILGGLAAASDSLVQGNSGLETYLSVFQGVIDSGDVMNFASSLTKAASDTGILLTEVVGDEAAGIPADTTIPNSADDIYPFGSGPLMLTVPDSGFVIDGFPAPLAGTEPLIAQFKATPVVAIPATPDDDPDVIVTRFNQGNHGTPVSTDPLNVFGETVSQIVSFFARGGNAVDSTATNTEIIADQAP